MYILHNNVFSKSLISPSVLYNYDCIHTFISSLVVSYTEITTMTLLLSSAQNFVNHKVAFYLLVFITVTVGCMEKNG